MKYFPNITTVETALMRKDRYAGFCNGKGFLIELTAIGDFFWRIKGTNLSGQSETLREAMSDLYNALKS